MAECPKITKITKITQLPPLNKIELEDKIPVYDQEDDKNKYITIKQFINLVKSYFKLDKCVELGLPKCTPNNTVTTVPEVDIPQPALRVGQCTDAIYKVQTRAKYASSNRGGYGTDKKVAYYGPVEYYLYGPLSPAYIANNSAGGKSVYIRCKGRAIPRYALTIPPWSTIASTNIEPFQVIDGGTDLSFESADITFIELTDLNGTVCSEELAVCPPSCPSSNSSNEPGSVGPQGIQGETGLQGIQGIKGDQGNPGLVGLQGPIGSEGPKGDKGDKGEVGLQGIQGIVGPIGPAGANGTGGGGNSDISLPLIIEEVGIDINYSGITYPFIGGQCDCVAYQVEFERKITYEGQEEQTIQGSAYVWGPITEVNTVIVDGRASFSLTCKGFSASQEDVCGTSQSYEVDYAEPNVINASQRITNIYALDGTPSDACGNPPGVAPTEDTISIGYRSPLLVLEVAKQYRKFSSIIQAVYYARDNVIYSDNGVPQTYCILVYPGIYILSTPIILQTGVNFFFMPGAIVEYTGDYLFSDEGNPVEVIIAGNGEFINRKQGLIIAAG